ncbi:MAG: alpha/beta hydrolase, partial [Myxococcota bacterium]|nr:alpha/beta hydrolase [Myxococcota bacterium]
MTSRLTACAALAGLLALAGCSRSIVATGRVDQNRPYKVQVKGHVGMSQTITLGEATQYVEIRGYSDKQPVLLYMHGGPGRSALPMSHVYGDSLERRFVVVHWDQRGTRRSYTDEQAALPLTLDRLTADTVALAKLLGDWFDKDRILLVAEGVGAIPAILAAKAAPEAFFALVLVAPIVDVQAALAESYAWVLDRTYAKGPREALQSLQDLGDPPWHGDGETRAVAVLSSW